MKKNILFGIVIIAALMVLGCTDIVPQPPGLIEFTDFVEQDKLIGGNAGLMDFNTKVVKLYDRDILPLNIKNSGKGPLVIKNIQFLQLTVPETNPVDAYDAFKFVEGTFPALPLKIPSGGTVNDIFIEFDPETAGDFSGKIFIETEDNSYYIDMIGVGLWELTLVGDPDGKMYILSEGKTLVSEFAGDLIKETSSTGIFNILCEPDFLRQFEKWVPAAMTTMADLEFNNEKSMKTVVTLKTHAMVGTSILDPYVYVETAPSADPDDFSDLQAAINYCNSIAGKIAVVVAAGTYSVSDITFLTDIPVYGGYKTSWTAPRNYKTLADRSNPTYRTILNVSGTINLSGSTLKNNVVLEGFTITKGGGGEVPLVRFNNSATAGLQYNNIISSGSGYSAAVEVINSAAPLIKYNYINGGNTSSNYSESYGIRVTEKAKPIIYKNSVIGGTANGEDSTSFGIFCDFETEPYIRNNTPIEGDTWVIAGGAAPGSGGKSYGIYIINNGSTKIEYNSINGGSGGTAVAMYSRYGSYIKARHNNIYTSGGNTRIGVWADHMGRVYELKYNGIFSCDSAMYKDPYSGNMTSIAAVNSKFNTESNKAEAFDLFDAPEVVEYE